MNVTLTLTFDSLEAVAQFLDSRPDPRQAVISFADRPDVGVSAEEKAAVLAPVFNPFANAVSAPGVAVVAKDAVAQVPLPPALSTAAVAVPPIAPAAPTSTATAPVPPVPVPPPAPAVTAPAAPAAPSSLAGIEVDADGLPWDARIHAGGRATNADGRWRQKRGLNDAALKARVEAELRQAMGAAASVPVPLPLPAPEAATTSTVPVPPPTTVPSPAAPSAPTAEEPAPQFLARVGGMLASGALTQERLAAVLGTVGLSTMAQLIVAPALIPVVRAQLESVPA